MNIFSALIQQLGNVFTWVVIVAPWEQALRVRLGKNVKLLGAGCYIRIPFVDCIYRQTIRQRMFVVRPQVLTTLDGRTISLSGAVGFRISDLGKLFNTLHDPADTIEAQVASAIAQYVASHSLLDCAPIKIESHVVNSIDLSVYGLADQ